MYTKNPRNHRTSTKKSFNLMQFNERYYKNENEQIKTLCTLKFSDGYVCPDCGYHEYRWLSSRKVCQCKHCYCQTSLLAGTIFQDSKLSFYQILLGIFFFVTSQSGINGVALATNMGININSARLFLRKLRTACKTENEATALKGCLDFDGAYLGGVDEGGKRGLGSKKQTVMVGVESAIVTHDTEDGPITKKYPGKARFTLVTSENGADIVEFMKKCVKEGAIVYSDGGKGISVLNQVIKDVDGNIVKNANGDPVKRYKYQLINHKFDKSTNSLEFVHKFISNLKSLLEGTYHGVNMQYFDLFIEEFTWRFNQRTTIKNSKKMYSLITSIFHTGIKTSKNFKTEYMNLIG